MFDRSRVWALAFPVLALAVATAASPGPQVATPEPVAALDCANPMLPQSILDGRPARTSHDVPLATVDVKAPGAMLHLAIAPDEKSRELGLMCVTRLHRHAGMLFEFSEDNLWDFWMKDTLVSLDMLWLSADGRVTTVAANVPAATLSTPEADIAHRFGTGRYVIELAAGDASRAKITVGTVLSVSGLKLPPAR